MTEHEQIIQALQGSDSRHPATFEHIQKKTKIEGMQLIYWLQQMVRAVPAQVNSANVTNKSGTKAVYWLTGATSSIRLSGQLAKPKAPPVRAENQTPPVGKAETKPQIHETKPAAVATTSGKRTRSGHRSPLYDIVLAIVEKTPGIGREELTVQALKASPKSERRHVDNMLGNLKHRGKLIRVEGYGKASKIYPSSTPPKEQDAANRGSEARSDTAESAKKASGNTNLVLREDTAAGKAAVIPQLRKLDHAVVPATDDGDITIFVDNHDNLCISLATIDLELNPAQARQLKGFLDRVQLGSAA